MTLWCHQMKISPSFLIYRQSIFTTIQESEENHCCTLTYLHLIKQKGCEIDRQGALWERLSNIRLLWWLPWFWTHNCIRRDVLIAPTSLVDIIWLQYEFYKLLYLFILAYTWEVVSLCDPSPGGAWHLKTPQRPRRLVHRCNFAAVYCWEIGCVG